ncbi:HAD domain-containing protein [Cupriavidus pauculus]|uniref:HAD domain-containing protein n=1 Tax=Cupriavidus pauculus TaxID=82633 RepID=UPI0026C8B1B9
MSRLARGSRKDGRNECLPTDELGRSALERRGGNSSVPVNPTANARLHHPGHSLFENVPLLEDALAPYSSVRIVLSTSWQLVEGGYEFAASHLSQSREARCIGGTFDRRQIRKAWFESMLRPDQVLLDVKSRQPARWVAVDDYPEEWPSWLHDHVVRTDPVAGIADHATLEELKAKVASNFGSLPAISVLSGNS